MAEIANNSIFSQTDASNTGSLPGISGSSAPSQIDDSIRALIGAVKREHDWRNYIVTSGGSSNAYTLSYSVAPAAYYTGQRFAFTTNFAVTGSATVNVNALGAKTIKKIVAGVKTNLASGDIVSGDFIDLVYDGTDMVWVNKGFATSISNASDTTAGIVELATTTEQLTATDANRASTPDSIAALWEKGSDVASAGTLSLGEGGYFHVTGTTTITDIDFATAKDGRSAILVFDGVLTLTHNSTTLVCPTGASITTAAGDTCCVVQDSSDNVKVVWYNRADGTPLVGSNTHTLIQTLTGTGVTTQTVTSISSEYRSLYIEIEGISHDNGTSRIPTIATSANNGSSYGTALNLGATTYNSSVTINAVMKIDGLQMGNLTSTVGPLVFYAIISSAGDEVTNTRTAAPATSGTINAIRFGWSGAGNFDAGTIRVYGAK